MNKPICSGCSQEVGIALLFPIKYETEYSVTTWVNDDDDDEKICFDCLHNEIIEIEENLKGLEPDI